MASSLFTNGKVNRRFHTPTTYRAQRRLFSASTPQLRDDQHQQLIAAQNLTALQNSTTISNDDGNTGSTASAPATHDVTDQQSNQVGVNRPHPLEKMGATTHGSPAHSNNAHKSQQDQLILPWEINGNKHTKLYATAPPKLVYPAGSRDESINERFVKQMDMFLNRNFLVRSILNGTTPHPFSDYERLTEYWTALGKPHKVFNTKETFATLDEIKANGHEGFHQELIDLLWFGGIVSYGNIMAETYAIIYEWIKPIDLPDLEGLCESNDGISFREVIINSLRVVRVKHTQAIINNLHSRLESTKIILGPGGMAGYFAKIKQIRQRMAKAGEALSDSYLIRTITLAASKKHSKLDECLTDLRRVAGTSGIPTSLIKLQDMLVDTFDFEIPDTDKSEKPAVVPANAANSNGDRKRGHNDGNQDNGDGNPGKKGRWQRRKFPKGSCENCPEATNHTTKFCWKTIRKRKGLPAGYQWCTMHKKGIHYEHLCKRHAPNYPPVPMAPTQVTGAAATASQLTPEQLKDRLLAMIASPSKGISIQRPANPQNFQPARSVNANAAVNGPPVDQIVQSIINMSPELRDELQNKLASAGL